MKPSAEHIHILRHSLGLTRGTDEYRNHFVAGGKDLDRCRELAAAGLMAERAPRELTGGDPWFQVTETGKQVARAHTPKPKRLSRGKRRYHYWLSVAECYPDSTFADFLTKPGFADLRQRADGKEVAA